VNSLCSGTSANPDSEFRRFDSRKLESRTTWALWEPSILNLTCFPRVLVVSSLIGVVLGDLLRRVSLGPPSLLFYLRVFLVRPACPASSKGELCLLLDRICFSRVFVVSSCARVNPSKLNVNCFACVLVVFSLIGVVLGDLLRRALLRRRARRARRAEACRQVVSL